MLVATQKMIKPESKLPQEITIDPEWIEVREGLIDQADNILSSEIENASELAQAAQVLNAVTKHSGVLEKFRTQTVKPLNKFLKLIKSSCDNERGDLEQKKTQLKASIVRYETAEAKRLAEEQRKREEEAQLAIQKQYDEHEAKKDLGVIDQGEEFIPEIEDTAPSMLPVKAGLLSHRESIEFSVSNITEVKACFLKIDEAAVRAFIRENQKAIKAKLDKGEQPLSGLTLETKINVQAR